jgi:leucyl-tRNA synthetase
MRNEFEYWYPMDMRVSGKDLIRNHLTMSLYNHAAIWKDNREQRMTRSYFCNGYLCLNGAKMSKSTGNFMTLRDCIAKFGVSSTRIALADAGDSLDDANFDEQVANAAILKLFVLESWIKTHAVFNKDIGDHDVASYNLWDRIVANEMNLII